MFRAQPGEFTIHQAVALLRTRLQELGASQEVLCFGIAACEEALGGVTLNTSGNACGVLLRRGYLKLNENGFGTTEKGQTWVAEVVATRFLFRWLRQPCKPVPILYNGACSLSPSTPSS